MPKIITTDSEIALIKAIKYDFTESRVSRCYFHLKQALKQWVALVPTKSNIHAIQYIKSLYVNNSYLDNFWNYFNKTWIKKYEPSNRNIKKVANDAEELINRLSDIIEDSMKKFRTLAKIW
ncbi:hypothetical protein HZS_2075 [Henneguya salminicola]|nr:hypothetical protein HZS_2075 [Henneguya salminicola]